MSMTNECGTYPKHDARMLSIFDELENRTSQELKHIIRYAELLLDKSGNEWCISNLRKGYGEDL